MSLHGDLEVREELVGELHLLKKINGYSAYEVAVRNGFEGTEEEWLESLKGEPGAPGEKGDPGSLELFGEIDAQGKRIKDVGDAEEDGDAISKRYADRTFVKAETFDPTEYASVEYVDTWYEELEKKVENHNHIVKIETKDTNADDYKEAGLFYFTTTYTPENIPYGLNGWLEVIANAGSDIVKQIWHGALNNKITECPTFSRVFFNGAWSDWEESITDRNFAQVLKGKLPRHINYARTEDYVYVDRVNGNDDNDGSTEAKAFKTIERAFELFNEGYVDLRINVVSAGDYYYSKSAFTSVALHIKNISSGEVNLKRTGEDSGVTAFYNSHINSKGVNWYGFEGSDGKLAQLYFEGCTTFIKGKDGEDTLIRIYPTIKTYGGFISVDNARCCGVDMLYTSATFKKLEVKTVDSGVDQTYDKDNKMYSGILAIMCSINFKNSIKITWEKKSTYVSDKTGNTYRPYHIARSTITFDSGVVISGETGGRLSNNVIFCTADAKTALGVTDSLNIWAHLLK